MIPYNKKQDTTKMIPLIKVIEVIDNFNKCFCGKGDLMPICKECNISIGVIKDCLKSDHKGRSYDEMAKLVLEIVNSYKEELKNKIMDTIYETDKN